MSRNIAIVVAAGSGARSGQKIPKQFVPLLGKPVLAWSIGSFASHPAIDQIIVVASKEQQERTRGILEGTASASIVFGGVERSDSVRAALNAIDGDDDDIVLIHDAARPGLSHKTIDSLLIALETHSGAAPALPVADALKKKNGAAIETIDRNNLFKVQTPQAFRFAAIKRAHADSSNINFVDDLEAAQHIGLAVMLVDGDPRLHKLTYPEDFDMAARMLGTNMVPRIGTGFDVHAFAPGDSLFLCGHEIEHCSTLKGHSDADVAWHALTDAILGALAAGDIGDHFPPSEPRWKGEPSSTFLAHAAKLASDKGYYITNIDLTIICEEPKIKPHRDILRANTVNLLGLHLEQVSIKATTSEGLGFTGRREGIAAQAAVVLAPVQNFGIE